MSSISLRPRSVAGAGWRWPVAPCLALALAAAAGCAPHQRGRELLRQGKAAEALAVTRAVDANGCSIRACALWRLGEPQRARQELLVGLAHEPLSAESHRLLGHLELQLGQPGAGLAHLERSLALAPRQPALGQVVAALLLERARLRLSLDERAQPSQSDEARSDLRRALRFDPGLRDHVCPLLARLSAGVQPRVGRLEERREERFGGACTGPPGGLQPDRPLPRSLPGACRRCEPERLLAAVRRRNLVLACEAAGLGLALEQCGCLQGAFAVWRALATEAPRDPRWPLEAARNLLGQGERPQAALELTKYLFLAPDRAPALLTVGELLLAAGDSGGAARRAVDALVFAGNLEEYLGGISLLQRGGREDAAQAAARHALAGRWGISLDQVRALVDEALAGRRAVSPGRAEALNPRRTLRP